MRVQAAAALAASALLAGTSFAQEEAETPIASSVAERPTFTVSQDLSRAFFSVLI